MKVLAHPETQDEVEMMGLSSLHWEYGLGWESELPIGRRMVVCVVKEIYPSFRSEVQATRTVEEGLSRSLHNVNIVYIYLPMYILTPTTQ